MASEGRLAEGLLELGPRSRAQVAIGIRSVEDHLRLDMVSAAAGNEVCGEEDDGVATSGTMYER